MFLNLVISIYLQLFFKFFFDPKIMFFFYRTFKLFIKIKNIKVKCLKKKCILNSIKTKMTKLTDLNRIKELNEYLMDENSSCRMETCPCEIESRTQDFANCECYDEANPCCELFMSN